MSAISAKGQPILIIGMHRSGTTLVSHLLKRFPQVHFEMEPHVLWKAGNFHYLPDNRFDIDRNVVAWIRNKLLGAAGTRILVEKSPTNCVRPQLVHAVFPDAKIVYLERDPVRCIYSNFQKTLLSVSFDPAIILRKYLYPSYLENRYATNGKKIFERSLEAGGGRGIHKQLRAVDLHLFVLYTAKMLYIRNALHALPFGPKLDGFIDIMKNEGAISYHVKVYREAESCKQIFQNLYGDHFQLFKLEKIHTRAEEISRLFEFCGVTASEEYIHGIVESFDSRIVNHANASSEFDESIRKMLDS